MRLTDSGRSVVPPVPPPPVPNPGEPLAFDDANPEPVPATFMTGNEDRVIHSINHRPRRIGGPAAAVAAVLVLIAVLIVTGLHSNTAEAPREARQRGHHDTHARPRHTRPHRPSPCDDGDHHQHHRAPRRLPADDGFGARGDLHGGRDQLRAERGRHDRGVLGGGQQHRDGFGAVHGTLQSGQSHALTATGPVTVIAGAPGAFSATVNGAPVTLPPGNQAPFTLTFQSATATPTA